MPFDEWEINTDRFARLPCLQESLDSLQDYLFAGILQFLAGLLAGPLTGVSKASCRERRSGDRLIVPYEI
ncbi:MAG: hypothetical protein KIPDCIKN_02841 [Haliscomenobacter sp.]|jgi:hypothetical protein|nr:hypothetical protein [Haliscomenobacter sp.]